MTLITAILLVLILGMLVLGPRCTHAIIERVTRAKAEFDNATRTFKTQLAAELELPSRTRKPTRS
ncbi:MAG: hypothetical protein WCA16_19395 [Candidatus Sulfotelmatobacter sp.]